MKSNRPARVTNSPQHGEISVDICLCVRAHGHVRMRVHVCAKKYIYMYIETYIDMNARLSARQPPQHSLDLLYHFVEE